MSSITTVKVKHSTSEKQTKHPMDPFSLAVLMITKNNSGNKGHWAKENVSVNTTLTIDHDTFT